MLPMKWLRALAAGALFGLTGCVAETQLVPRAPEGYNALRFRETVRISPFGGGTNEFPAGTVLIQDRVRVSDGEPLYCGPMLSRGIGAPQSLHLCHRWRAPVLYLGADYWKEGYAHRMPDGAIEEIRVK